MIFIFDLDDTIYCEENFFFNGLLSVSKEYSKKLKISYVKIYKNLIVDANKNGREKILDRFLISHKILSKKNLKTAIKIFRYNTLKLKPYKDFIYFLSLIKNEKKYIVTDGNKLVQKNKINKLGISKHFNKIFISRHYGIKREKPSLYCFKKIMKLEKCKWKDLIYIGDNPKKDFINLNKKGSMTIRLLRGNYKKLKYTNTLYNAKYNFKSMNIKFTKFVEKYAKQN